MMGHGRFIPEKEPSKLLAAVFASLLIVSSARAVELFRYRYNAGDGREFECVFESDEQTVPKTVGEEKAAEIAMDWMRFFTAYGLVQWRARNLEQGQSHIGFSVFQRRLKDQSNECILSSSYPTGWLLNRNLRSGCSCVCPDPI